MVQDVSGFQNVSGIRYGVLANETDSTKEKSAHFFLGDRKIDFIEFMHLMGKKIKSSTSEADIERCFSAFDRDEDGYITVKELKNIFLSLGENIEDSDLRKMMKPVDTDEDGLISYGGMKI